MVLILVSILRSIRPPQPVSAFTIMYCIFPPPKMFDSKKQITVTYKHGVANKRLCQANWLFIRTIYDNRHAELHDQGQG